MPQVARITVYPIKSLDPVELHEARVLPTGRLEWDREYALFDERGRVVNGKREPRLHRIRATYNLAGAKVTLSACGMEDATFSLESEGDEISRWLSRFLGYRVELRRAGPEGFPDDTQALGPTIVSTGTLVEVASWFPGMSLGEARLRFRANIEVSVLEAFWEERVFSREPPLCVRVGQALFRPRGISRRCAVPSRNPFTGSVTRGFQRVFVERRRGTLLPRFSDNPYRLVLNTEVVGDGSGVVRLFEVVDLVEC